LRAVQRGVEATRRTLQTVTKHGKPAVVALERRCTLVASATVRNFWQRQQTRFESFEI
jgi:antitoxin (DNA-binding transcriptional repressor) of toxin-antitoxin stability system